MAGASAFIYFVIRTFRPPLTQCTVLNLIRLFYTANTYFNQWKVAIVRKLHIPKFPYVTFRVVRFAKL